MSALQSLSREFDGVPSVRFGARGGENPQVVKIILQTDHCCVGHEHICLATETSNYDT